MGKRKASSGRKGGNLVTVALLLVVVALVAAMKVNPRTNPVDSVKATASQVAGDVVSLASSVSDLSDKTNDQTNQRKASTAGYKDLELTIVPKGTRNELVRHTGYVVSHNSKWKIPNWVGYELTRREVAGNNPRDDAFAPDPDVRGHKAELADYKGSGYDRGHMAPAADMKWSKRVMRESFYLSNMCPQNPSLNRGDWNDLEEVVRKWAKRDSAIIVVCGPIVSKRPATIGHGKVAVPKAFFKVVLSPYSKHPSAIGFIMPNEKGNNPLRSYAKSVDEVEDVTGFDFFSSLPDDLEGDVEARYDLSNWNL